MSFWMFALAVIIIDTCVFLAGYNSMFYQYKTDNELEKQRKRLGL